MVLGLLVLALNGSNDLQVPPKENLETIEIILKENGNEDVETKQLENLNHLFQESETAIFMNRLKMGSDNLALIRRALFS